MITQNNLKEVLEILGFEALSGGGGGKKPKSKSLESKIAESNKPDSKHTHIYTKTINSYIMQVDFTNQKLIYPQDIKIHDTTTSNFSHPENFVVFECVHRLLEKGYKAESLELEPRWQLGREAKSGKADILVRDNKNAPYLIIECKTAGENSKSEFSKEWERMQNNGGQLFSYFQQEKATKFLCLYTSDLEAESKSIKYQNYIIQAFDNDEYLQENELENSYKKASNSTELFAVWKESYKLQSFTQGIFESQVNAYKILELTPTFSNLQELKEEGKYHEFAKILRKHNISGKENAFDKLVNIFLCKIYDESFNKNNLKFGYFGVMADTYANMQDRLMLLYKEAMSEFLGEEITFVSNDDIEKAFKKLHAKDLKAQIQKHIKELKFYSNNDFAFLEVHNKELFLQNALVLKEIIELFAPYKLTQNSTNQFLGNLFELFLQKGMKQDEGQFFTPIQICEFIMYALPLDSMTKASKPLKVLDFACGAGHFLNTYANEIKRYITQDLQEHYKQIYGIEKEYRLSKVAKVSSAMYGQNEINILYADALATHELENPKTDKGNKQKLQIDNHSFDLLIANPPYSVKGFLETLSAKSKKTYTLFTNEINIETNNAIECFFIERANQLLRDNAKAAIILPSSILNKDGLYKSTREILLINFDFIAIVELGSGTFGATGTNTIILFLRKKDSFTPENATISQDYSNIKNYIESGHLSQNEPYKDYINAFNAYCDFRGFDKGEYESFLNGSLESYPFGWVQGVGAQNSKNAKSTTQLLELDTFKEYRTAFKETSEYKKLLDSKAYKDSKDKDTLAHNAFLAYARAIEKDKLLYFSLSLNQAPIIIKAPNDNKEQKRFLGYEWSNRKGDEGLKELHSPYLSPLFERDNPHNPNKLAHLIRQAFLESSSLQGETPSPSLQGEALSSSLRGSEATEAIHNQQTDSSVDCHEFDKSNSRNDKITIPQDLSLYAFKARLIDMLDFSKVDFNKAISLNPTNSQGEGNPQNPFENCKYELVRLESLLIKLQSQSTKIPKNDFLKSGKYPIVSQEGDMLINGWTDLKNPINDLPLIIFGDHSCNFKFIDFPFFRGADGTQVLKFNNEIITKFAYFILQQVKITNAEKYERHFKYLKNLKIPLPPLEIQKQIVSECERVEEQYNTIRAVIEKYQELIKAILVKCGIVDSNSLKSTNQNLVIMSEANDLNDKDLITSLLDSIQELESKLDFSLLSSLQSEVPAQSLQESSPSLQTQALHNQQADSSMDCHDFTTQNLAMIGLDFQALLDSLPTPPPHGWEVEKIGNILSLEYGKALQENKRIKGDYPVMGSNGIVGYHNEYFVESPAIIVGRKGSAGKITYIEKNCYPIDTTFYVKRIKQYNFKLLYFVLQNLNLEKMQLGIGVPGVNRNDIYTIKIPLPPLEAQEKIISAIESVESKIKRIDSKLEMPEKRKAEILSNALNAGNEREREQIELKEILREIESLLSQRKTLQRFITKILQKAGLTQSLESLLTSLPTPPTQGWERVKLGQVVSVQSGGTPSREVTEYWNGDINWIKSEVCQNCYVYENQVKEKITELGLKKSSAKILKKDSVLIALVGATIGKVGYLTFDSTTNQNIAGLYPLNSENLNTKFLYFACLGLYRLFVEKGGFTMANLAFIKNLKIPLPPLEAQEKIINTIEKIESKIHLLEPSLSQLDSKKSEILANALSD